MNLLKGKNQYLRIVNLIICIILLLILIAPTAIIYYSYSNELICYFYFGSYVIDLGSFGFPRFNFDLITLISGIPLILCLALLMIYTLLYNRLEKKQLLGLSIVIVFLIILEPIIILVVNNYHNSNIVISIYNFYWYFFIAAIIGLGAFKSLKKFSELKEPEKIKTPLE